MQWRKEENEYFLKLSIFHLLVLVYLGDNGSVVNTGGEKG